VRPNAQLWQCNGHGISGRRGSPPSRPGTIPATTKLNREAVMLNTILVVLVVLWLLGMVTQYTLGGFIHLLLFLAVAMVLIRIIQGRKPIS
jgi:hypothetical protein